MERQTTAPFDNIGLRFKDDNTGEIDPKPLKFESSIISIMTTDFGSTSVEMQFIYAMMQKDHGAHQYKIEQILKAQEYLQALNNFDPRNKYTINVGSLLIIKEPRQLRQLTGGLAVLEDRFLKDKTIPNRQTIIGILDDVKRDFITDEEAIDKLSKYFIH